MVEWNRLNCVLFLIENIENLCNIVDKSEFCVFITMNVPPPSVQLHNPPPYSLNVGDYKDETDPEVRMSLMDENNMWVTWIMFLNTCMCEKKKFL